MEERDFTGMDFSELTARETSGARMLIRELPDDGEMIPLTVIADHLTHDELERVLSTIHGQSIKGLGTIDVIRGIGSTRVRFTNTPLISMKAMEANIARIDREIHRVDTQIMQRQTERQNLYIQRAEAIISLADFKASSGL